MGTILKPEVLDEKKTIKWIVIVIGSLAAVVAATATVLSFSANTRLNKTYTVQSAFPELTEREILAWIAEGANSADITTQLTISKKTVRNHVSNIFNKLQVTDRVQAILCAREAGLGKERTTS